MADHGDHHPPAEPEAPVARLAGYGMLAAVLAILLAAIIVPVTGARPMIVTTAVAAAVAIAFGFLGAFAGAGKPRRGSLFLATMLCAVTALAVAGLAWQETGRGCAKGHHRVGMICKAD